MLGPSDEPTERPVSSQVTFITSSPRREAPMVTLRSLTMPATFCTTRWYSSASGPRMPQSPLSPCGLSLPATWSDPP
ncbi:MAG: hypothetical protein R3F14_08290 [Polyangiaceae bacterium]